MKFEVAEATAVPSVMDPGTLQLTVLSGTIILAALMIVVALVYRRPGLVIDAAHSNQSRNRCRPPPLGTAVQQGRRRVRTVVLSGNTILFLIAIVLDLLPGDAAGNFAVTVGPAAMATVLVLILLTQPLLNLIADPPKPAQAADVTR